MHDEDDGDDQVQLEKDAADRAGGDPAHERRLQRIRTLHLRLVRRAAAAVPPGPREGVAGGSATRGAKHQGVSWRPPKRNVRPLHETRDSWFFNLVSTLVMIVIAYVAALFLYLIMAQVAAIPTGAMVEGTTLRESILFIQLT